MKDFAKLILILFATGAILFALEASPQRPELSRTFLDRQAPEKTAGPSAPGGFLPRFDSRLSAAPHSLSGWSIVIPSLSGGEDDALFDPQGRLLTPGRIFSYACRDFDKDGRLDIVVSDYLNPARILFNDAGLEFKKSVILTSTAETASTGHGVAVEDFNGDGRSDLFLVYNEFSGRLLFDDGKGGFRDSGQSIGPMGYNGTGVQAADFDGDGDMDAFVTYYQHGARFYFNSGQGVLTEGDQEIPGGGIAVGDVDGDKDVDILSQDEKGRVSAWLNEKGRFSRRDGLADAGEGIIYLRLVDFDSDGDLDFVALGRSVPSTLWVNDGRGSFRKSEQVFGRGIRLASGDIDRDGRVDLVIGPAVWLNKGGGRFGLVQTLPFTEPASLGLADIDGDGDLDLLAAPLDRPTGKADLRLFLNTLIRR